MKEKAQALLDQWVPTIRSLEKRIAEAYWMAQTTGDKKYEEEYARYLKELIAFYADANRFEALKSLRDKKCEDPILSRQVELLYLEFAGNQMAPDEIEELVNLETEIESAFVNYRATYRDRKVSDNELKEIFRAERDTYKRKDAWKASKQVGGVVADRVRELVRLRNKVARNRGWRDYYDMSLQLQELDEKELFTVLADLKEQTDQPFANIKKEMDKAIASRYVHLRPEGLRPWHYEDPFFQEAPAVFDVDLDRHFREKKLEDLGKKTFRGVGLDIQDILERSDLYEREGKSQHAFCIDIDREGDTRILCNLRPDAYWVNTLLHELGHAVYDKYHDAKLPYLLRKPAHISSTEAIAMLMGRMGKEPVWLFRIAGLSKEALKEVAEPLAKQTMLEMLIFVRWCLVMIHFERELYADPEQDLNRLWWDYVERFQFVPRPEGRDEPDWAAKIHLGTSPVYYQNYLLGELTASQIFASMKEVFPAKEHPLVENEEAGRFLQERIFFPGARYPWNEMLERATGEKLSPRYFVEQFLPENSEEKEEPPVPRGR
ncbi:M2 family metallopeptidase [Salinithrix halophila]|uniref:M2 family metallopeptidase n=1 Tax=Salinithrix halophila TaxID=1485204 RepID=A0ABV8JEL6_9BACL